MTSLGEDLSLKLKVRWNPLSSEVIYDQLWLVDRRLAHSMGHLDISLDSIPVVMDSPSRIKMPYFLAIFKISNFRSLVAEHPEGLHPTGLQLIISFINMVVDGHTT